MGLPSDCPTLRKQVPISMDTNNNSQRNGSRGPQGAQRPPNEPNRTNMPGPGRPNGRSGWWGTRWLLIIVALLLLYQVFNWYSASTNATPQASIPYSLFIQQVKDHNVTSVDFQDNHVQGDFRNAITYTDPGSSARQQYTQFTTNVPAVGDPNLIPELLNANVSVTDDSANNNSIWITLAVDLLPWLLIIGVFFVFSRRATQGQQNIFNFGRSRAKLILEDRPSTTFADVAGVDEAKHELQEVVEFLKTPQKFQRLGGKIPRGALLVGPPGTGKTLLAKAVAGEAGVPFFSMSGSEFVEVLVGVGASRVRDLFEQAKKASPSIIFIDEIDAVGRQRGTSITTNDEREQTLNQLLVEMDGFDTNQAVVVLAATNRPDGLDQALLRPGRFDRRVVVDRPDWKGRLAILRIHTRDVPLDPSVDLLAVARATPGMVGADLANLVNEAALLAARRNLERVTQQCFEESLDKIIIGAERPLVLNEQDLRVVAYHEGGHALVALLTPDADPVTKVTIVPRGQALGVTQQTPLDDRYNYSREYLMGRIMVALGGRAAEEIALGSITTGAENDLQVVTGIARQMVTRWGMSSRVGTISFSDRQSPFMAGGDFGGGREYSEETAALIDQEVKSIVESSYDHTKQLLADHHTALDRIAQELRKHESLNAGQLQAILQETGTPLLAAAPPTWDSPTDAVAAARGGAIGR
jgi:cell division protease FtsH